MTFEESPDGEVEWVVDVVDSPVEPAPEPDPQPEPEPEPEPEPVEPAPEPEEWKPARGDWVRTIKAGIVADIDDQGVLVRFEHGAVMRDA